MAAPANITDSTAINAAMDQEFIANFQHDMDRLAEILGIFGTETMSAGTVLKMLKVTGELNNAKTDASKENGTAATAVTLGSSSGSSYIEGDEVALSKFNAEWEPVAEVKGVPYRKMTTAAAIQKSGYVNAVLKTDQKMLSLVRGGIVSDFFTFLKKGTGAATGKSLQAALAMADAALGDSVEANGDEAGRIVHFVNRQDAAEYLGSATITDQNVFGMTYLQNFLGVSDVFLTNKVDKGGLYVTPVENVHIFGLDFGALSQAGLAYATDANGLIGVAHGPAYDRVSVETHVLTGCTMFPEVKDYIVKGTVAAR